MRGRHLLHMAARTRRGFTLIELLVVISVIALLVGILLPALGKARQSARAMVCGTQMQQIGVATAAYRSDNDAYFTWSDLGWDQAQPQADRKTVTWDDLLTLYHGVPLSQTDRERPWLRVAEQREILICPEDDIDREFILLPGEDLGARTYSIVKGNQYVPTFGGTGATDHYDGVAWGIGTAAATPVTNTRLSARDTDIPRASNQISHVEAHNAGNILGSGFLADVTYPLDQISYLYNPWESSEGKSVHGSTWNYLYADGHVAGLRLEDTVTPTGSYSGDIRSCSGSWSRRTDD